MVGHVQPHNGSEIGLNIIIGTSLKFKDNEKLDLTKIIFPHANGEPLLKWSSSHSLLTQFCNDSACLWSTNNNGNALTSKASSNVNLLHDDTYRWECASIIVSSFGQIEQSALNKEILDLLNEESISGARSGRAIRECASTLYVGLARTAPPTNTNFRLTFLLTRLQEALYEDLAV